MGDNAIFLHQHLIISYFSTIEQNFKSVPCTFVTNGQRMSHFTTLSPGHYIYETRMINSFCLSYFPPTSRLAQLSPILYLPAEGTRPLKSLGSGSLFLPCVSINLWRADWCREEPNTPLNKRRVTPPAETPEMNHIIHAFLFVIVSQWRWKNTIWKPNGRLVRGHAIQIGSLVGEKKKHETTTHVLFSVLYQGQVYCRVLKPDHILKCAPFLLLNTTVS